MIARSRWLPLLLLGVALAGCPQVGTVAREIPVDVLVVKTGGGTIGQGTVLTTVRVEPNADGRIHVGSFADTSLGTGSMWRSTIWVAAFQAAMAVDQDLSSWRISVEVDTEGTGIDGPSAGGVIAAAMMAGMTGETPNPAFAMTGTINPDGSIGPVGGIPHKFVAALEKGKTTLGYPGGQRYSVDLRTQRKVDLEAEFSGRAKVREIKTIFDAYELLTGRPIRRPTPVASQDMAVPPQAHEVLMRGAQSWLQGAIKNYRTFQQMGLKSPALDQRWREISQMFGEVDRLLGANAAAAAYWRAATIFIRSESNVLMADVLRYVSAQKHQDAVRYVASVEPKVKQRIDELLVRYRDTRLTSPGDLMTLIDGYEALTQAVRSYDLAKGKIGRSLQIFAALVKSAPAGRLEGKRLAQAVDVLFSPLSEMIIANVNAMIAGDNLALRTTPPIPREVSRPRLQRLSKVLGTAARANLNYFEATTIYAMATARKMPIPDARRTFPDPGYQNARLVPAVLKVLMTPQLGSGTSADHIAQLSGSLSVYIRAAMLIAKYYSLKFKTNPNTGSVVGIGRERAFEEMLTLGERMAREHAARALEVTREIPMPSRITYQIGRAFQASRSLDDRIEALEQFWRSSLFSQLAVMLHRAKD